MKLNKTKLKQIILEVLREQEEMVQMIRATVEETTVERTEVSKFVRDGYSEMKDGNVEVDEVNEMIRTAMEAARTKEKLQDEQPPEQQST